jgi:hypothetical protein
MHSHTIGQCDWSGIMFSDVAIAPKVKTQYFRGVYCNWECALAHAELACSEEEVAVVRAQAKEQIGHVTMPAPHYEQLEWFGGTLSAPVFIGLCETESGELDTVVLTPSGEVQSKMVDSIHGRYQPGRRELGVVHTNKHFEIVAFSSHDPNSDGQEFNKPCAVKFPQLDAVRGNVCMVKRSLREPWRTEYRYLDLSLSEWEQLTHRADPKNYRRAELQSELDEFASRISKNAVEPLSLLKGMKMPGKRGKAIAEFARQQEASCVPPAGPE